MLGLSKRLKLRRNEQGDTIVEVLISIAIISLILGGAYVTTNNSLRAERGAQERTDAVKLIQSQIESLKNMADDGNEEMFSSTGFCITGGNTVTTSLTTNTNCKFNATGSNGNSTQPVYYLKINRVNNTFTVVNTWDSITSGNPTSTAQMTYRIYAND